ncbi:MAG: hypothetical protein CMJ25_19910 [Phycisphaerae bacterium]|nr:hypothetical protein [Phycisphaerae bacterium]|tara:strand:+ start:63 stop:311 length:249 start_codon:yes stop_codon:yes gene_type:complete
MNPLIKLYLLSLEIIPLLDDVEINGVKVQRDIKRVSRTLETFVVDACDLLEKQDTKNEIHDKLVTNFGKIMDSLTEENIVNL